MAQDDIQLTTVNPPGGPAPSAPQQIIIQQPPRSWRFGKWILIGLVFAVVVIGSMYSGYQSYYVPRDMPQEKYHSLDKYAAKKIAIIEVSGPIYDEEDGYVKRQIDLVREDPSVVGVVLRIDSPGGTVTGSDYVYHHLRQLAETRKLPLVVSMGSVCASGGYYVAMAVGSEPNSIFAEPTTWTGSIGVIIPHFDMSGALSALQITDDSIASGPYKQMGSPTRPMTDEDRKLLQSLVDDSFARFKEVITSGRPKFKEDAAALEAVATGQIFTASQARERGLVDQIGFVEAAIARATELADLEPKDVRCVKYEEPPSFFGDLAGANSPLQGRGSFDIRAILELMTPRAYYLWTWLPAVMSNSR
jgi:protease IV